MTKYRFTAATYQGVSLPEGGGKSSTGWRKIERERLVASGASNWIIDEADFALSRAPSNT